MRIAAQHLPIFVASDERKPFYGKATMSLLILWRRVSGLACCEADISNGISQDTLLSARLEFAGNFDIAG
jgi:hypothetical protein